MALDWEVFEGFAEHVLSWLDAKHLGRMEIAFKGVDRKTISRCWGTLASVEWHTSRPWLFHCMPCSAEGCTGKDTLKKLLEMKVRLKTVPARWSPTIKSVGPCCLKILPSPLSLDANSAEEIVAALRVPPCATVPLALGVAFGEEMSVGVEIQCKPGRASEGVWFGLAFVGDGGERVLVLCAPSTGRCMRQFPGEPTMFAQAMGPLTDDLSESVKLYATISKSGDVEFSRVSQAANSIVRSGRMPRAMFPAWASEVVAAISIQIVEVPSETTVLTKWGGLLREVRHEPEFEFAAEWSLHA